MHYTENEKTSNKNVIFLNNPSKNSLQSILMELIGMKNNGFKIHF